MSGFTNTFGGSAISPADVAFKEYSIAADLVLFWPQFSYGEADIAARFMNISASVGSLDVIMPDATLVSVGYDVVIFNAGAQTFNVVDSQGGAIATIPAGKTFYILLKDNTAAAGTWQTVQFGVGTSSADAAALAGAGLLAIAGMLNVNFNATTVSNDYTITTADRAILQVWTGGTGAIELPLASAVGNGFFFPIANNGSGDVTVTPQGGDTIDGNATTVFTQTNSGFLISSGSAWYTLGKGVQNTFAVSLLNLNVSGNTDVTETSAQAGNILQQFTGALTGNIDVIVPNTVQLYYIFNNTTGSFSLTVKTAAGTGVTVAQGTHTILYCDGTNVINGYTASVASTVSISAGSANSPNFNFVGNGNTGIYSPSVDQIAMTAGGFEVMNFVSEASSVNYLQSSASATTNAVSISALGSDGNISINLLPKGTGSVVIGKVDINGGAIDGTIIGGAVPAAVTGTTINGTVITASTNFAGSLIGNVTGNVSGNAGTVTTINGQISAGTNINITGSGTSGSPYVINSSNSGGTVTSVAMTGDNVIFATTITGSPITTSGTLIPVLKTQTANTVLAGPTTGGAATPTFRALVAADIPALTIALSSLATQAANTVVANATAGSAAPTAIALSTQQALGRLGSNITGIDIGTAANNLVQLNASSQLPAVSGALLTNLPIGLAQSQVSTWTTGTTKTITVDFTTYSAYEIVLDGIVNSGSAINSVTCLVSSDGGSNYAVATVSSFSVLGTTVSNQSGSLFAVASNNASGSARITVTQPATNASTDTAFSAGGTSVGSITGGGSHASTAAINTIKFTADFQPTSGGRITYYPIAKR